jgi:CRISPR-associated endonuclease/helicase Cas3
MQVGSFVESGYKSHFERLTKLRPFDYQIEVARLLFDGRNILLRAPTGAGKTWAVLAPFLFDGWKARPTRLIYALPLRTLAQGVYHQARDAAKKFRHPIEPTFDKNGHEKIHPYVTLQTGEQPDDEFFDRGRIIVTTYDQVLSGLLEGPYGLSDRLHNINAAAIVGALVVFDEFHLMPTQKAFLTAAAGLHLFRELCQSVWMTATATQPLEAVLREALDTAPVPATPEEAARLHASLPSVRDVTRSLQVEESSLGADAVLKFPQARSIVLANTVGRAQDLYRSLAQALRDRHSNTPIRLLHARFFKQDRQKKEAELQSLLGRDAESPAILVATQVIEAGIDISCDHLHTELCPMNSLVQRAGRCARFPKETGTVHVYPLPNDPRSWLPYGDPGGEDPALSRTRELLARVGSAVIDPKITTEWVEEVHAADDAHAVQTLWTVRERECLERIHRKAILRDNRFGVADMIRGDDSDSLRVIVAYEEKLPETPAKREAISMTRWSLAPHLDGVREIGWFWDSSADEPAWKPLRARDDLRLTYALCLRPEFAQYTEDAGLILGISGDKESPRRVPPPRPGHALLKAETWVHHARCVADETAHRMERECPSDGFLAAGLSARYQLSRPAILEAARACALLHDLGKLQIGWQRWAEVAMHAKRPSYVFDAPLAHTDFNSEDPQDRQREREVSKIARRPAHAPASAFYSLKLIPKLVPQTPGSIRKQVASACLAAVLAHHGGWVPERENFARTIGKLAAAWKSVLPEVLGDAFESDRLLWPLHQRDKYGQLSDFLNLAVGADSLADWWPLVSYLTRTLRLSDQRATAEGHNHE